MSEVNKAEIVDIVFCVAVYICTIYPAYLMAKCSREQNVGLRIIINWYSLVLFIEVLSLGVLALFLDMLDIIPSWIMTWIVGFAWSLCICSFLFLFPFFILLWIYNIVLGIIKGDDPV